MAIGKEALKILAKTSINPKVIANAQKKIREESNREQEIKMIPMEIEYDEDGNRI